MLCFRLLRADLDQWISRIQLRPDCIQEASIRASCGISADPVTLCICAWYVSIFSGNHMLLIHTQIHVSSRIHTTSAGSMEIMLREHEAVA